MNNAFGQSHEVAYKNALRHNKLLETREPREESKWPDIGVFSGFMQRIGVVADMATAIPAARPEEHEEN